MASPKLAILIIKISGQLPAAWPAIILADIVVHSWVSTVMAAPEFSFSNCSISFFKTFERPLSHSHLRKSTLSHYRSGFLSIPRCFPLQSFPPENRCPAEPLLLRTRRLQRRGAFSQSQKKSDTLLCHFHYLLVSI